MVCIWHKSFFAVFYRIIFCEFLLIWYSEKQVVQLCLMAHTPLCMYSVCSLAVWSFRRPVHMTTVTIIHTAALNFKTTGPWTNHGRHVVFFKRTWLLNCYISIHFCEPSYGIHIIIVFHTVLLDIVTYFRNCFILRWVLLFLF